MFLLETSAKLTQLLGFLSLLFAFPLKRKRGNAQVFLFVFVCRLLLVLKIVSSCILLCDPVLHNDNELILKYLHLTPC